MRIELTKLSDERHRLDVVRDDGSRDGAEHLVGPMQSLWNGRLDEARYLEMGARMAPDIVDASFVARTRERLRQLQGHWRATAYRQGMQLHWPPRPARAG